VILTIGSTAQIPAFDNLVILYCTFILLIVCKLKTT
jgi:hypothetical protein